MNAAPQVEGSHGSSPTRFLVELENACAALRLYGESHPVFRRNAGQAAAALTAPLSFSISPQGFVPTDTSTAGAAGHSENANEALPDGAELAQRLRALGLVGIRAQPQLMAAQVEAFVRVLLEAEREHLPASAVEQRIAAASGQHIKVVPLRLGKLNLVHGSSSATDARGGSALWRDLFRQACGTAGHADSVSPANVANLARTFESAAESAQTPGDWQDIVESWQQSLCSVAGGAGADSSRASPQQVELVSKFLQQLDPALRQRLLATTFSSQSMSQPLVLELAGRLPERMILEALATVAREDRQPSSAALALLRKVSAGAQRTAALEAGQPGGASDPAATYDPTSRLNAALKTQAQAKGASIDVSDFATTVQKLLGSQKEDSFVPADYLRRRQELSITELSPRPGSTTLSSPSEKQTARHAADLVFRILSQPESQPEHLTAGLEYLKDRTVQWINAGQHNLVGEMLLAVPALCAHTDAAVAIGARSLIDELVQLVARKPRQFIGSLVAIAGEEEALKTTETIISFAAGSVRCEIVEALFSRNIRWPLPLTESLLKDGSSRIRRLAVMRLTRDHDLSIAASFLRAASHGNAYFVDVAQGLAELLYPSLSHPEVRSAYKAWWWSRRRWAALFSLSLTGRRDAA